MHLLFALNRPYLNIAKKKGNAFKITARNMTCLEILDLFSQGRVFSFTFVSLVVISTGAFLETGKAPFAVTSLLVFAFYVPRAKVKLVLVIS